MWTISSRRKIHVNVPAVQSQSPAVRSESGDLLNVTERATGAPFLIQLGSIGSGCRSVRVVSNVAHCKLIVFCGPPRQGYTSSPADGVVSVPRVPSAARVD